ncbi:carboxyl-terminal processing protease [Streptosporangium subroseum]|uniref:Carboxyl-terminal processing protease n=1 Tax=Streptosporangium subroseum TaxID=106412 RepID=A0A239F4U3_9ACTN|nr:S41 family peptidase [Streptosporangium subroseum]SNS51273.1 carboxyl-terminal processing protease [Streptosporangium subroseum]
MTMLRTAAAGLALFLATACTAPTPPRGQVSTAAGTVCAPPQVTPGAETATTIDVIEQAYLCILGNYYSGTTLDARSLLAAGLVALTQELNRSGRDVPEATMPALTGDRRADWTAFETTYRKITDQVPGLRDRLAVVTLESIVAALGDNHARWTHDVKRPPDYYDGDGYGLGLKANVSGPQMDADPGAALPPLFVTTVQGGAAQAAGLRPGDVIESINGSAPFIDGKPTPAIAALYPQYPDARPVRLRLLRQTIGRRWTVTLKPGLYQRDLATLQLVRSKLLEDDIAYVRMTGFAPGSANRVLKAISRLRTGRTLSGVVLDLRGNGGGSPVEAIRLLSAFVHGKVTAYQCTVDGRCLTSWTDDTVELLNLPLAVLTDRGCASACEHFSSAVKDLRIGRLVGTRTAGVISGPARGYLLANNTLLSFPGRHHLGPDREVIDRIGVPPDHYVPLTPKDTAAGRDPALAKALTLLHT